MELSLTVRSPARPVFLQPAGHARLSPHYSSFGGDAAYMAKVQSEMENFLRGGRVSVSKKRTGNPQLRLLEQKKASKPRMVWELRLPPRQVPGKTGIRVFGMFAQKDLFIGMFVKDRDELRSDDDYKEVIRDCHQTWQSWFPSSFQAVKGENINDCVSNAFDIDKLF